MPVPKSKDVGTMMRFFKKDKPSWPHKRILAAALDSARRAGAKIAPKAIALFLLLTMNGCSSAYKGKDASEWESIYNDTRICVEQSSTLDHAKNCF